MIRSASVLLHAEISASGILGSSLSLMTVEAVGPQLGVFIYLLLASTDISMGASRKGLLNIYPIMARSVALALRGTSDHLSSKDSAGQGAEMLSNVLTVMRLSFVAAVDPDEVGKSGILVEQKDDVLDILWNRIWPDWVRLISLSLDRSCTNTVSPISTSFFTIGISTESEAIEISLSFSSTRPYHLSRTNPVHHIDNSRNVVKRDDGDAGEFC